MKIENDMRERREELKLSRVQVADAAGCSVSAVYAAETGGMPRGGQTIIDKIEAVLRGQKGGAVWTDTVFNVGDVVSGTIADEQILIIVRRVGPTSVGGTEIVIYDNDGMKKCIEAGANVFRFNGRNYIKYHSRDMHISSVTGHWAMNLV